MTNNPLYSFTWPRTIAWRHVAFHRQLQTAGYRLLLSLQTETFCTVLPPAFSPPRRQIYKAPMVCLEYIQTLQLQWIYLFVSGWYNLVKHHKIYKIKPHKGSTWSAIVLYYIILCWQVILLSWPRIRSVTILLYRIQLALCYLFGVKKYKYNCIKVQKPWKQIKIRQNRQNYWLQMFLIYLIFHPHVLRPTETTDQTIISCCGVQGNRVWTEHGGCWPWLLLKVS